MCISSKFRNVKTGYQDIHTIGMGGLSVLSLKWKRIIVILFIKLKHPYCFQSVLVFDSRPDMKN
jgi:hypothetical protein